MLNSTKTFFEILAIVIGGMFVFLTWGVDIVAKREPSWKVEISDLNYYRYKEINEGAALESCYEASGCETVACKFDGNFKITNTGLRPVHLGDTQFDAFFLPRTEFSSLKSQSEDRNKNLTPHSLFIKSCGPDEDGNCANEADFAYVTKSLDEAPLFPNVEGWRPFSFQIEKGGNSEEYFLKNGLIIRARQKVYSKDPIRFWEEVEKESVALIYVNTPCGYGAEFKPPRTASCEVGKNICKET